MTHTFNPTILREYDIRGIVGDTLTEADAYALGRTFAALAREEGARAHRRRPRRPHPLRNARSRAGPRADRRRDRRRADRHGPEPDALFRDPLSRRRRRHPGHRQPQPGRLQRLQAAAQRPLGLRRRRSRRSGSARPPATGATAAARPRRSTSARPMSNRLLEGFSGKPLPHRLGRRQRRRGPDPRHAGRAPAGRASRDLHRGRRHLPQPPPRPDGRERTSPT